VLRRSDPDRGGKWQARIYWGDAVDFNFDPPDDVKADVVAATIITVDGYYERYSYLRVAADRRTEFGAPR
jgi:hypothetical protein